MGAVALIRHELGSGILDGRVKLDQICICKVVLGLICQFGGQLVSIVQDDTCYFRRNDDLVEGLRTETVTSWYGSSRIGSRFLARWRVEIVNDHAADETGKSGVSQ